MTKKHNASLVAFGVFAAVEATVLGVGLGVLFPLNQRKERLYDEEWCRINLPSMDRAKCVSHDTLTWKPRGYSDSLLCDPSGTQCASYDGTAGEKFFLAGVFLLIFGSALAVGLGLGTHMGCTKWQKDRRVKTPSFSEQPVEAHA